MAIPDSWLRNQYDLFLSGFHMLVEMGGDIEGTDEFGRTRLIQAVISGHEKTAKVFISIFHCRISSEDRQFKFFFFVGGPKR